MAERSTAAHILDASVEFSSGEGSVSRSRGISVPVKNNGGKEKMNGAKCNKTPIQKTVCPVCEESGKKVELHTVRALIKIDLIDTLREEDYSFCPNPDCTVIYYSASSNAVVRKDQLITRIGIKEKESPRPVCYCFEYTVEDIHGEILETGRSTLEKDISDKIHAGLCHCEDANPEGRCCIRNITIGVKECFRLYGTMKKNKETRISKYR